MTPKDMLTNPSFCPMPWSGIMYNFDGEVKNCIRSSGLIGNIKDNTIEEIISKNTARQQIQQSQPVPTCNPCYDLEKDKRSFDIISDRVFYIKELKSVDRNLYSTNNFDLTTVDIRWSNLCNFGCVYCGPQFSSKWSSELDIHPETPTDQQRESFKNYIMDKAPQLKHVYMAGGEPLLMKENLELLARLNPDVNLRINTNLSRTNTKIFDKICEFKNVQWTVSAETIEEEYEYIRHGGVWKDFLENLTIIQKLNHKINFNMLHFILNYNSLFDAILFFQKMGFHNNSFVVGAMLNPEYLNIRNLPEHVLHSIIKKLDSLINNRPGYLLEDSYRNLRSYLSQPYTGNLSNTFQRLGKLDSRRGLDSSKIFKDLYKLKEGK